MRSRSIWLIVAGWVVALLVAGGSYARAEDELAGRWKLVLLPFGEDEFLLMQIEQNEEELTATVREAHQAVDQAEVKSIERSGDELRLVVASQGTEHEFAGRLARQGEAEGHVLGTFLFHGTLYPARLEKTEAGKLQETGASKLGQDLSAARRNRDAGQRVAALEKVLEQHSGPKLGQVYAMILQSAQEAELSEQQVRDHLEKWLQIAGEYGPAWLAESQVSALRALQSQPDFAAVSLDLAKQADKKLGEDALLEQRAAVLSALAAAARSAGDEELAKTTDARLAEVEGRLDEEYRRKVPPFEPEAFAGREDTGQDRVVLLELFTGAQCPPCVAADVAFDALLETFQPTELVALQYHLHIPGPDPLTSPDSVERSQFYQVQGTPSTYFNGEDAAGGGGGMANAEAKYKQYRQLIEEGLKGNKRAKIDLAVERSGNELIVAVRAEALEPAGDEGASDDDGEKASDADSTATEDAPDADDEDDEDRGEAELPRLRLRLVLTEEVVRYVGGNKLRFHHHVVRGLPGGSEGKELVAGQCEQDLTISLEEIRKNQEEYLAEYAMTASFPNPLPGIPLEKLMLVAFVQDDTSHEVLHTVAMPVPDAP